MQATLNEHELAMLHAKFVLPIVVDHMLRDEEPLDDIAEHAMNEMLSEMQPDTALLCVALCGSHIAGQTNGAPMGKALAIACNNIIDDYGPLWISHEQNSPHQADMQTVTDQMSYLPEDLETMRDLMLAVMDEMEETHCMAAILCDILSTQAECHRLEAEIQLATMNITAPPARPLERQPNISMPFHGHPPQNTAFAQQNQQSGASNVIQFPGGQASRAPSP